MKKEDFTTTILVDRSASESFKTILDVRKWWSGLYDESFEGSSEKIGDEFSFHAGGGAHYSKQQLIESVPNKKLVWLVTDSNLSFIENTSEWNGTRISFEIAEQDGKTKVVFTHIGLNEDIECYDSCAPAWTQYMQQKLLPLLTKNLKQYQ